MEMSEKCRCSVGSPNFLAVLSQLCRQRRFSPGEWTGPESSRAEPELLDLLPQSKKALCKPSELTKYCLKQGVFREAEPHMYHRHSLQITLPSCPLPGRSFPLPRSRCHDLVFNSVSSSFFGLSLKTTQASTASILSSPRRDLFVSRFNTGCLVLFFSKLTRLKI